MTLVGNHSRRSINGRLSAAVAADQQTVGILFNKIRDTVLYAPATALALHVTGDHEFINANTFEFLRVWGAAVGIDFAVISGYQRGEEDFGMLYNYFSDYSFNRKHLGFKRGYRT